MKLPDKIRIEKYPFISNYVNYLPSLISGSCFLPLLITMKLHLQPKFISRSLLLPQQYMVKKLSLVCRGNSKDAFCPNRKASWDVRTSLMAYKDNTKHCNLKVTYYQPVKNNFKFHKMIANRTQKKIKCCCFFVPI